MQIKVFSNWIGISAKLGITSNIYVAFWKNSSKYSKKPLRFIAENLPFVIYLITLICVIYNSPIDTQDAFIEKNILLHKIMEQFEKRDEVLR